jgi:HEAT repeats
MSLSMRLPALFLLLPLTACETTPDRHVPTRERSTAAGSKELFRNIGLEFEAGRGDEIDPMLGEACKDPKLAASVARLMMFHMQDAAQRQQLKQSGQFQLRDLESNFRYTRARSCLGKMGLSAVPTVIDELMMNRFSDNRRMGVQILSAMPAAVLPAIEKALVEAEPKFRRHYAEAVAGMKPTPESKRLLLTWSKHEDYSVRAASFVGLANAGKQYLPLLRDAVTKDPDHFVQRQVVRSLERYPDRRTAAAVIEYYARAQKRGDRQGIRDAERTLVKISKQPPTRRGRLVHYGLAHWRKWVLTLPVDEGNR